MITTLRLKLPGMREDIERMLDELLSPDAWVWTGESSAEHWAVTTPQQRFSAWSRVAADRLLQFERYRDDRFFNCELRLTYDPFVFFDRSGPWASRIESCLALSQLDKREREIARDIERTILETSDARRR
jgi:hypothetical protein